ncbi:MAG: CheR family methyltransferase [Nibricoccus sp.]
MHTSPEISVSVPEYIRFEGVKLPKPERRSRRFSGTSPAETVTAAGGELVKLILDFAGLKRETYRQSSLFRRVPACLRYLGVASEEQACAKVRAQPKLAAALVDVLLIGVTGFFRDTEVFQSLEKSVIPQLGRSSGPVRIWSAACSNGQELYSLAILLSLHGFCGRCELLGTDVRAAAVARAARGVYPSELTEGLPERWKSQLRFEGDSFEVSEALRRGCTWKVADLFKGVELGPWDMILWRNMAVFLDDATAAALWKALYDQLSPGGYIVTGTADYPPPGIPLRPISRCVFQRSPSHEKNR